MPAQVRFHLLPTGFVFKKGQAIRLSIGGADAAHFTPVDGLDKYTLTIMTGPKYVNTVFLPTPQSSLSLDGDGVSAPGEDPGSGLFVSEELHKLE